jgi:hypothetical protein
MSRKTNEDRLWGFLAQVVFDQLEEIEFFNTHT